MNICFYSPYFPNHFGGGEKHLLDVAGVAAANHQVCVAVSSQHLPKDQTLSYVKKQYQNFMNQDLAAIEFVETPLGSKQSAASKLLWTARYDGLYYVSDGSLFFSLADHNYLHVQVPFSNRLTSPINRLKLKNWRHINTNSHFTKSIIEKNWRTQVNLVLHPMINEAEFTGNSQKQPIILNVGRFFKQLHSKRQDILIEMFQELCLTHHGVKKGWKLVLAGSTEDETWLTELKKMAKGFPIEFKTNLSRKELIDLYQSATIYWHAAGYGIDENICPEAVEHFGISTVEAMAASCVPLVYLAGGQREVLGEDLSGLGWHSQAECVSHTWELMKHPSKVVDLGVKVRERASHFNERTFAKKVNNMFNVDQEPVDD